MRSAMLNKTTLFADLLLTSQRELFGFIYSLVQNLPDAEDIYQETAIILWQKFDEFTPGTNFSAWAMRVAHLRTLTHIRTKRKQRLFFSTELLESIAQAYQREAVGKGDSRREALAKCLEKLPPKERRLLTRCYSRDRNYSEIARAEGRTIGALYKALSRIRKALFACVESRVALESRP